MTEQAQFPYTPREWAIDLHALLADPTTRALVIVNSRRSGKTWFIMACLVLGALTRPGRYGYILPLRSMAKAIAWPILRELLQHVPDVEWRIGDMEVTVACVTQPGKLSTISFHSADDNDNSGSNIRGLEFVGLGVDECSQVPWSSLAGIMPTQSAVQNPWAIFSGTPRQHGDSLHRLFQMATDPEMPGWHGFRFPMTHPKVQPYYPEGEVERTKKTTDFATWMREYGASFDHSDENVLIRLEATLAAAARGADPQEVSNSEDHFARHIGVDVGFQQDESVIVRRCHNVMHPPIRIKGATTGELAYRILREAKSWDADSVTIDAGAAGQGVIDYCRELGLVVSPVMFGQRATDPTAYQNARAEMYDRMRKWIEKQNTVIPDDPDVTTQISATRYKMTATGLLALESKDEVRKRLGTSPDIADALAMTFWQNVESGRRERRMYHTPKDPTDLGPVHRMYDADGRIIARYSNSERTRKFFRRHDTVEQFDPYSEEAY